VLAQSNPEGWWRLFRRDALAGQSEASPKEIAQATRVATAQLNARAKPWIWGRPRHQIIAAIAVSFVTAFKELSISRQRESADPLFI
jgi:hypothetical protein